MERQQLLKVADSKKWMAIILFTLLGFLFFGNTFAKDLRKLQEKSFNVKSGETLSVSASVADVYIKTWDKDEFNIKVFGNSKAADRMRFYFEKTSFGVKVRAEKEGSWFSNIFGSNIQVRFEIMIPRKFVLDIETSGGDITVDKLTGKMDLHTSGGDIKLAETDGELKATTSGGDIGLYRQHGYTYVETSGGDIVVKETIGDIKGHTSGGDVEVDIKDGRINLETSGGDVTLRYAGENKGISLYSSGGDIHAYVPSSFKADAEFKTTGGDVECELNTTKSSKISHSRFFAELNGGGNKFTISTSGGDITVKSK